MLFAIEVTFVYAANVLVGVSQFVEVGVYTFTVPVPEVGMIDVVIPSSGVLRTRVT